MSASRCRLGCEDESVADPGVNELSEQQQVCTYCVMDKTEPQIQFDHSGRCDQCRSMEAGRNRSWFTNDTGLARLEAALAQIKSRSGGSAYDCILGLSGGVDSSYMALKMHEWGLRPLVVHIDAGWNSELAVRNIERLLDHCGWELHTDVINWEQMRALQLAYLRSGVANQDVPQDHAFFAGLYRFATQNGIRTVFSGGNVATEGVMFRGVEHAAMDAVSLKAIFAAYGHGRLEDYPTVSMTEYYLLFPLVKRMTTFRPLNLMPYHKEKAVAALQEAVGWNTYDRKHGESLFTKVYQNYLLPARYGVDKRKAHLSSLVVSGQMSREEAVAKLEQPLYDAKELERDLDYLCRKLRITRSDFEGYLHAPQRAATELATWDRRQAMLKRGQALAEKVAGRRIRNYS